VKLFLRTPGDFTAAGVVVGHERSGEIGRGVAWILILVVQIVVVVAFVPFVPFFALIVVTIVVIVSVAFFIIVVIIVPVFVVFIVVSIFIDVPVFILIVVITVVRVLIRASRGLGCRNVGVFDGVCRDCFHRRLGHARFGLLSLFGDTSGARLLLARRRGRPGRPGRCIRRRRSCGSRALRHRRQGRDRRGATTCARILLPIFGRRTDDDRLLGREGARWNGPSQRRDGAALPHGLVESDARGHGNVERRHLTEDWQGDHVIAVLLHEPANAFAFAAQDQNDGPFVIDGVPALFAGPIEAHDPETLGLQGFERLHDVPDPSDLHAFERACGGAGRGVRKRSRVPVGEDHTVRARGVDAANDRAKISRILDPVEEHEESGCPRALLKFLEA
jgi:hypothetical protein